MRNIDKWACVCACSVVGLAAAVGPAEPGSIKHDSPHEINYSWRGFWGALSGGPVCVRVHISVPTCASVLTVVCLLYWHELRTK